LFVSETVILALWASRKAPAETVQAGMVIGKSGIAVAAIPTPSEISVMRR
jgi:hypothetical protein